MTLFQLINSACAIGSLISSADIPVKIDGSDIDIDFCLTDSPNGFFVELSITLLK